MIPGITVIDTETKEPTVLMSPGCPKYLDIALTAVHYGIYYCPGGNFGLYVIGRIQYDVYIVAKSVHGYSYYE